jgi:tripartite-type tricarboxylate transporter receptor subunit TctC
MQPELARLGGMSVVIENIGGAGGVIGLERFARRPAAERGLAVVTVSDLVTSLLTSPTTSLRPEDFRLVALLAVGGAVLLVREGLPVRSFDELVAHARHAGAQGLKFGHFGVGSWFHLLWEDLSARTQISTLQVPYKGAPDILKDLSMGEIDVGFLPLNTATVAFPKVRPVAMTGATRNPYFADLPTLAESRSAAGFKAEGWFAAAVMRDTPATETERYVGWIREALQSPAVAANYKTLGAVLPPLLTTAELDGYFKAEVERYRNLVKSSVRPA